MKIICDLEILSIENLQHEIQKIVPFIKQKTILLFEGPAGSGKTTSVQILCEILGIQEASSPSFAIINHYKNQQGLSLSHVDLYRLEDSEDLESTGFWDLLSAPSGLIAIEWADRLNLELLPMNWQKILIQIKTNEKNLNRHLKIILLN